MCAAVSEEAASDILVGAQPRIRCWARARSLSSELVDTATARRQQRVEDAARVGLQFPFRSERRGRGAPSVAMKWRDAVKAAIMHGPLPPDVTLDAPHWWLPGMPLLPPADYMAPVPLKRKRDTSAEPKTEPAKRAYRRTPDEAKLWFQDFHAYQARVLAYNIRRAKHLVELFGPVAPDTFRRWHEGGAPDHRGRPPVDLPPFALSRLANLTHAVAARLSLSVTTWQHVYRRVLRELDIEFEPKKDWTRQFLRSLQLSRKLAATCTRSRPSEADIARERKTSAAARHLPVRSLQNLTGSHMEPGRDSCAHRSSRRAWMDKKSQVSPCLRFARLRHGHACCEHEGRHVDTDCL